MTKDLAGCIHGLAKYGGSQGRAGGQPPALGQRGCTGDCGWGDPVGWPQEQHTDHKDGLALQGSLKGRK